MTLTIKEKARSCPVKNSDLMHYIYILLSRKDANFYTGLTNDLKRRLREHQTGNVRSTWNRRPLELIYYEACLNEDDAKQREIYLEAGMLPRGILLLYILG